MTQRVIQEESQPYSKLGYAARAHQYKTEHCALGQGSIWDKLIGNYPSV